MENNMAQKITAFATIKVNKSELEEGPVDKPKLVLPSEVEEIEGNYGRPN